MLSPGAQNMLQPALLEHAEAQNRYSHNRASSRNGDLDEAPRTCKDRRSRSVENLYRLSGTRPGAQKPEYNPRSKLIYAPRPLPVLRTRQSRRRQVLRGVRLDAESEAVQAVRGNQRRGRAALPQLRHAVSRPTGGSRPIAA